MLMRNRLRFIESAFAQRKKPVVITANHMSIKRIAHLMRYLGVAKCPINFLKLARKLFIVIWTYAEVDPGLAVTEIWVFLMRVWQPATRR